MKTHSLPISILDLAWVPAGDTPALALQRTRELAVLAEQLGFHRFWVAEHHNSPGVACCATSLVLGYVAAATTTIRVGSGGVMLPNHAPLVVAEQFGTLDTLYPGRVDLGLGRAPGTDGLTVQALRRDPYTAADSFPQDVLELQSYFAPLTPEVKVAAIPAAGRQVPLWILGSSTYGAQVAAALGMPYVFASHFAPQALQVALDIYRRTFRPSAQLDKPYAMVCAHVYCADSEAEAQLQFSTLQQMFYNLHRGRPEPLQPPKIGFLDNLSPAQRVGIEQATRYSAVGTPEHVAEKLLAFAVDTQADELMIASPYFDHQARLKSHRLVKKALAARQGA
jgi:luciferase family oxidoreductase group 1